MAELRKGFQCEDEGFSDYGDLLPKTILTLFLLTHCQPRMMEKDKARR
jgi:hypothetical protein